MKEPLLINVYEQIEEYMKSYKKFTILGKRGKIRRIIH